MKRPIFRRLLRQLYTRLINTALQEVPADELQRSAIVFSPHQDDETLGCGGTIIRKRQAGADVTLVFMTDGSRSHAHLMAPAELKTLRTQEAIAAAQVLGVEADQTLFLNFPDGSLHHAFQEAQQRVEHILATYRPAQIFIPYYQEAPSDHAVTNQIVRAAIARVGCGVTVYEYPIWFWNQVPFTRLMGDRRAILAVLTNSLRAGFGWRFLHDFKSSVSISEVLEQKQIALNQHRSQVQKLMPHPRWYTLKDISDGEFLECFLQPQEIFYSYTVAQVAQVAPTSPRPELSPYP